MALFDPPEWPRVPITEEALRALQSQARGEPAPAERDARGRPLIALSPDTLAHLRTVALAGESVSDTIIRFVAQHRTPGRVH